MEYTYKTKPFKHQLDALSQSACKKNFAYFMEMGCVDGETEFLSNRGWIKFSEFNLNEWKRPLLVAQALPNKDDITRWGMQFVEPISFIKKKAYDWYTFYGRKTSSPTKYDCIFKFTGDHMLPIQYKWNARYHGKVNPRAVNMTEATAAYLAKCIMDDPTRVPRYPAYTGSNLMLKFFCSCTEGHRGFESEYYIQDSELATLNEWEIRFMVAAMADGTFPNKTNNKVDFYFKKERKVERLKFIAARAGIPIAYEMKKCRHGDVHIIHAIAPMKCKVFDERWYSLPYEKIRWIAEEIFYWDGWRGEREVRYYTIYKESIDFAQFALAACGWESRVMYNGPKRLYTLIAKAKDCYNRALIPDGVTRNDYSSNQRNYFKEVEYDKIEDDAYCFRVPSGYLLLRRNGKIIISGNSGKTKVMIDNIGVLHLKGQISGALILAPKGVYRNWSEKEIPMHLPDTINREVLVWDASASQGRKDALKKQIQNWDGKTLQFMVFNIESLVSEKGKKLIEEFIKRHNGNVLALVDESTCIKNHKAKRTKAAIAIAAKCKARRIATGSPVTNSPLDLYSQCAFLDKSLLGFGSYYAFKNTYANIERVANRQGQHYEKIISYKNLDNLSAKLDKFSYRITKKECLDLPDKVYMTRDVELTDEQRRAYNDMANHQFAMISKDGKIEEMSTQIVLTKFLRLHQVLCGTFTTDDGEIIRLPNKRIDALKEVLEETSGKVIIWATYLEDIKAIAQMLEETYGKDSFVTYYGATTSEERIDAINAFQNENSSVRFFLGNVQTAGRGITLTAASTVIYYSNNFSLELRQQSEDRAHRLGQKNKVVYIDLVVRNSLDEKIIKSLIEKRNIANEVLKDDLEEWISLSGG